MGVALPIKDVSMPADLKGQTNGKLDERLLVAVPGGRLHHAAASAWLSLQSAASKQGIVLYPTSPVDTYRTYGMQELTFIRRYDTVRRDSDSKVWNGTRYWLKPGCAPSAVPGTSNHGWGLAVDVANCRGATLDWLLRHAILHGFSWESQSEPWHLRYFIGWQPSPTPAYDGPYTLGSRGNGVKAVQRALRLPVDGIYGAVTAKAVRAYRAKHPRLWPASAVCNEVTYNHLTRM